MELKNKADITVSETRQQVLSQRKNVGSVDEDAAAVGTVKRAENLKQGCLACSARTYNRDYLAAVYSQADVGQDVELVIAFVYVFGLKHIFREVTKLK